MEAKPRKIEIYQTREGRKPYCDWFDTLDLEVRKKIDIRMKRVQAGNFGDHHGEGRGVWALIFDFGPGYRVYFGLQGGTLVLLLCGGQKKRQGRDIVLAHKYWEDYRANH
jgi:putative addiction module killer protein